MLRLWTAIFLLGAGTAWADGGPALASVRTAQSVAANSSLVELTGLRGAPRPPEWTLLYSDPQARGGVLEVVVSADVIVSQRTPLSGYAGMAARPVIRPALLTVDSDAAFAAANKQAGAKGIGFHWVDYSLRTEESSGDPVWTLRLYDHMGAQVGTFRISASSGKVITPLVAETRQDEQTEHASDSPAGQKMGGVIGAVGDTVTHTATKVKDSTLRAVGTVQEVLTGRRTIGPKDDD